LLLLLLFEKGERNPAAIRPSIMQRRFLQKPKQKNLPPAVRMVDSDIWRVDVAV